MNQSNTEESRPEKPDEIHQALINLDCSVLALSHLNDKISGLRPEYEEVKRRKEMDFSFSIESLLDSMSEDLNAASARIIDLVNIIEKKLF